MNGVEIFWVGYDSFYKAESKFWNQGIFFSNQWFGAKTEIRIFL